MDKILFEMSSLPKVVIGARSEFCLDSRLKHFE
jgi:hypothetical protein